MGENAESYLDKVRQPVHICWIVDTAHSDGHAGHHLVRLRVCDGDDLESVCEFKVVVGATVPHRLLNPVFLGVIRHGQ